MTIKSFFADSVAMAIRMARRELGEDAMLLRTRRSPEECRHLGSYEVVFGVAQTQQPSANSKESTATRESKPERPAPTRKQERSARVNALYAKLIEAEMDAPIAQRIADHIQTKLARRPSKPLPRRGAQRPLTAIETPDMQDMGELERFFARDSSLDRGPTKGAAVLIGPPGAGKTSAIARLAVDRGLAEGKKVLLVAAHDRRVGGTELLRRYASLLTVEYRLAENSAELQTVLDGRKDGDLVLIDTPGLGPKDMESERELAAFLATRSDVQKHLVLPATWRRNDLDQTTKRFAPFRADRLLFTRLDETSVYGAFLSEVAVSGLPLSFVTTGQQVPGDLTPAEDLRATELLRLDGQFSMQSAA